MSTFSWNCPKSALVAPGPEAVTNDTITRPQALATIRLPTTIPVKIQVFAQLKVETQKCKVTYTV